MFYLRDFPNEEMTDRFKALFPQVDVDGVHIFLRLLVLGSECLADLDRVLAEFDLSHGRWIVLMLLRRRAVWQALPSELAREQGVTKATMSGLTQRLEKQGLVTREPDERDRRRMAVALTPEGAQLVERILPECIGLMDRTLARLDGAEKTKLKMLLEKLFPLQSE